MDRRRRVRLERRLRVLRRLRNLRGLGRLGATVAVLLHGERAGTNRLAVRTHIRGPVETGPSRGDLDRHARHDDRGPVGLRVAEAAVGEVDRDVVRVCHLHNATLH